MDALYQDIDDIPYPAIGEPRMHFIELNDRTDHDSELDDDDMLMMAGRGCIYLCSFCVNSVLIPMNRGNGQFLRLRSPENVIEEINYRRARCSNAKRISFNDEVFGVFDDWVADFAKKYKEQVGLPFECELVPKLIKEHNVKQLADAGLFSLHFGIQSGHDDTRREIMHRPGTNDEFLDKALILTKYGVTPQFDMILGNPFDTVEALEQALDLLMSLPQPMRLNTYKMQYFPHYPFSVMAIEAGHISPEDVSYEAVADSVLFNWIFKTNFSAGDRKIYLENCIYLLPWHNRFIWSVVKAARARHSVVLGALVSTLARVRYETAFKERPALIWARRLTIGIRLILRGDARKVLERLSQLWSRPTPRPNTGRISTH